MPSRRPHEALGDTSQTATFSPELVEAVARRVIELGADRGNSPMLTVPQVAAMLQVKPSWVYAHAARLGGYRLGEGARAPLRFDVSKVKAALRPVKVDPDPLDVHRTERLPRRGLLPVDEE